MVFWYQMKQGGTTMQQQTLGAMIASLRKERQMTQLELAEQLGVTDKAVSKWERNLSCPDIAAIPKLADILGVSVEELLRAQTAEQPAEKPGEAARTARLILRAVPVAMGAAVTVLAWLGQIDVRSGLSLLGIGLFCMGLEQLGGPKN